ICNLFSVRSRHCTDAWRRGSMMAPNSASTNNNQATKKDLSFGEASDKSKTKLLAIDDNAQSLQLICDLLAEHDLDVLTAEDPVRGLEIFSREKPQIVISDAVMPGLSGMDVLDRIVAEDPITDVILLTGHYSTDDAVMAIRHGAA